MLWLIQGRVTYYLCGLRGSADVASFILDGDAHGIRDADHALDIAEGIVLSIPDQDPYTDVRFEGTAVPYRDKL